MNGDLDVKSRFADPAWRAAIIGGLAAFPVTTALYAQTGHRIDLTPVFFGGFIAGYLYGDGSMTRSQVAARVGFIGSLPILWMGSDMLVIVSDLASPLWFHLIQIAFAVVFIGCFFAVAGVTAMIGAWVGDWLSDRIGRGRLPTSIS
ncbi:DUF5518 domain-containing protein [Natrinema caseinilyticum]|uniref:DUF5518 domain-containing protein n=1 Tax=Natrinema caseinilyticum TaxID=2961570 RepID=UPI0020C5721C|nr:DUF5518 domain-containing protein [Natrinema caseinilyticum]